MSLPRLLRPLARQWSHPRDSLSCSSRHSTPRRRLATAGPLNDPAESPANAPTVDAEQLTHLKRSFRGGQDLSQRHTRLERSVRGKTQYGREILDLQTQKEQHESQEAPFTPEENIREASTHVGQKTQRIFKGLVIPEPPKPPAEDECCMSGCAVCVYDLYDEARQDYVHALDNIRARLDGMGVPEEEWPSDIRRSQRPPEPAARPDVVLSAFEQFEKALRERKERERRQTTEGVGKAGTDARSES